MHSYLYLDLNQNQQFDVTKIEDEELLLCTYYNPNPSTPEEGREKSAGILQQSNTWPYNSLKLETPFTAQKHFQKEFVHIALIILHQQVLSASIVSIERSFLLILLSL